MVNGPVVKATPMDAFQMREMVTVGPKKLVGEVVKLEGLEGTIQVYEETEGLRIDDGVVGSGKPLSVKLGPGLLGNIFDGIERPLNKMHSNDQGYIDEGVGLISIDLACLWSVRFLVKVGDRVKAGEVFAEVIETELIVHRLMIPSAVEGVVKRVLDDGDYPLSTIGVVVDLAADEAQAREVELALYQEWPIRVPRAVKERHLLTKPLLTGQRVLDTFFPLAKGGTAAIPGGFGTGKTITQHQLAKWSDADVIVYIGCGERGNEMTEVLDEFPKLIDPKSNKPLMARTILIANTSNMPVAAREASIYTGITIAEYYRDMGYHVAVMADSTSRWAEALREISGRLEEMPAEEGYPAYLASRLAEFYERAGLVTTRANSEASVTIIGAVSPAGGDFSEPVTENTQRFVNAFLALDKDLAYARHYPSINWLTSYSGYKKSLEDWYTEHVNDDFSSLRTEMLNILHEEHHLSDIVQLVGEDVLPDNQRLILEISRVLKEGFLQQNAFHSQDAYVPILKQYEMLNLMRYLWQRGSEAIQRGIPISLVRATELYDQIIKMKYTIPNDNLEGIGRLKEQVDAYYNALLEKYN